MNYVKKGKCLLGTLFTHELASSFLMLYRKTKAFNISINKKFTYLVACSEQSKGELTRIDVISLFEEKSIEYHIHLEEELTLVENVFQKVNWQPNAELKLSREPDVEAVFLYAFNKNMAERLISCMANVGFS